MDIAFLCTEMRTRLLRSMQGSYQELYHHELIDSRVFRVLNEATEDAADDVSIETTWIYIREQLALPKWLQIAQAYCHTNKILDYFMLNQLLFSVNCLTAFMRAITQAQEHVQESFVEQNQIEVNNQQLNELNNTYNDDSAKNTSSTKLSSSSSSSNTLINRKNKKTSVINEQLRIENIVTDVADLKMEMKAFDIIKKECRRCFKAAQTEWSSIQHTYPDVYAAVQTQHATSFILHFQRRAVKTLEDEGILSEKECQELQNEVDKVLYQVTKRVHKPKSQSNESYIQNMPILASLPIEIKQKITTIIPHIHNKGDLLFSSRSRHDDFLIVLRGNIRSQLEDKNINHIRSVGMCANLPEFMSHLFYDKDQWLRTNGIVESIHVHTIAVPKSIIINHFLTNKKVEEFLWKLTAIQLFHYKFSDYFPGLSLHDFQTIIHTSEFEHMEPNTRSHLFSAGFLLSGSVTMQLDNNKNIKDTIEHSKKTSNNKMVILTSAIEVKAPAILAAQTTYDFKSSCILLLFDPNGPNSIYADSRQDVLTDRLTKKDKGKNNLIEPLGNTLDKHHIHPHDDDDQQEDNDQEDVMNHTDEIEMVDLKLSEESSSFYETSSDDSDNEIENKRKRARQKEHDEIVNTFKKNYHL